MFIDTHAHLNFNAYKEDSQDIFEKTLEGDVSLIMPGSQYSTSKRAVELAEKWDSPRVWASVGLHPIHVTNLVIDEAETTGGTKFKADEEKFVRERYEELLESEKVIAIGEIGLDYWHRPKIKEEGIEFAKKQAEVFVSQLDLALEYKKPAILHCRVAHKDLLKILQEHKHTESFEIPGVVHSYTGSPKQLKKFLSMGYYVGVNGLVFTLGLVKEAVEAVPLDRILLETDAPYLSPPEFKQERNEPLNVKYVAEKIAEIKGVSLKEVEKQTEENAKKVFGIDFH